MTLRVRRIISLVFIFLFLIITPAILLYAAGYKLGRSGFSIQRTGMFIIESNPKNAKIFLNGKVQRTFISTLFNKNGFLTAPAKIKNLLPGEYDLSLELEGYFTWHKKLTIDPGASTYVKNIFLFKNNLPIELTPAEIPSVIYSPDKNYALIKSSGRFELFDLANETKKIFGRNDLSGNNIYWSSNGQQLIIDRYFFSKNDLNSYLDINNIAPGAFNYKWSNNILYFQSKDSLFELTSENLPKIIISRPLISDYLIKDGYLYLISRLKQAASLIIIDLSISQPIKEINLPASADYSFIQPDHALLNLYDDNHKTLYLINPLAAYSPAIVEVISNLKTAAWPDNNNLIYANDFEIWLFNLSSKEKTLITRISDIIGDAIMHPDKNYIIYSTGQAINAIELDERDKRNIVELAKFKAIGPLALNIKGDLLYFTAKIGDKEALYKLSIQ